MRLLVKSRSGLGDSVIAYNLAYNLCRGYELSEVYLWIPKRYAQLFHGGPVNAVIKPPKYVYDIFLNLDIEIPDEIEYKKYVDCNEKWWGLESHSYPVTMFLYKLNMGHLKFSPLLPIKHHLYPKTSPHFVFCNSSKEDVKCFSKEIEYEFIKTLIRTVNERRFRVSVVGGQFSNEEYGKIPKVDGCTGQSIVELCKTINSASAFIGVDSGPMHIAASLKRPTVGIFGPSDWRTWMPAGNHTLPINAGRCTDCLRQKTDSPKCTQDSKCMDKIDVQKTVKEIVSWLNNLKN